MDTNVNAVRDEIKDLRSEEVVVTWGGTNDISKNNIKISIKHVCHFVEKNEEINIVIMKLPHGHELIPSSCVNIEVIKFDRQAEKKMKIYSNVKMLETDTDRKHFTKHGQHLNLSGREQISMKSPTLIKEFSTKKLLSPVCMQWKDYLFEGLKSSSSETEECVVHLELLNHNLDEHPGLHTPPNIKENGSNENPRFFMDITPKHYHKVNETNKSTTYLKIYEGWNFNCGNAAVTFDTAHLQCSNFHRPSMYSPTLCRTRSQR